MSRVVTPDEARDLMDKDGYAYLDVRSVREFSGGHPTGAFNVPLLDMGPQGMTPNPDFLDVVQKSFGRDAKLVVACQAGGRSRAAVALLEQAGFTNLVDLSNGFEGRPGGQQGWRPRGLPVSTAAAPERTYAELKAKAGG